MHVFRSVTTLCAAVVLAAGGLVGTVLATTASRPAKAVGSGQPKMEQARQFLEQALRALDEAANDKYRSLCDDYASVVTKNE